MTQVRVQILLEPRQHTALKKAAKRANTSVSEIIRQITDEYLIQVTPGKDDSVLQTLENFKSIREKQTTYHGDLVAEIRSERQIQQDESP